MQVVLAASICSRGGKAILSRSFREIARSRVEALLAAFPKLADSSTQHTTVEQDNVRYVYQPLDELYMVLITNPQSNILQDIDTLHLFAQVVSSVCRSLDEREISRHAFELLSAFDEIVTLGYRENLSLSQVKTFLEMESHEERIQMIIEKNKELEAAEERKRKAKQLEMQRREMMKSGRGAMNRMTSQPSYSTYTPPSRASIPDTIDSYETEKRKTSAIAPKAKGLQLRQKSKAAALFDNVRNELGSQMEENAPLITSTPTITTTPSAPTPSAAANTDGVRITISETINAKCTRDGTLSSIEIKGDLQLLVSDPSLTKIALALRTDASLAPQYKTHPHVDKAEFGSSKSIQLRDTTRGFPLNISVGVLRWRVASAKEADAQALLPIKFEIWTSRGAAGAWTVTVEYEKTTAAATLQDVLVVIPYASGEPTMAGSDAVYEISADGLEWPIGTVGEENATGSFEFECDAEDDAEFFPMNVSFSTAQPIVEVDVSPCNLLLGFLPGLNFGAVLCSLTRVLDLGCWCSAARLCSGDRLCEGGQVWYRFLHDRVGSSGTGGERSVVDVSWIPFPRHVSCSVFHTS